MARFDTGVNDPAAGKPADRRGRFDHIYAALDLGTNNCRLLVARAADDGFRVIDAFSRIVRLGEGLGQSGVLSEAAMGRTIAALRICAAKLDRRGVTRLRAVATEACRRAVNCADFVGRVADETGLVLDIISTAEEARLALAGCAPLLDYGNRHALVFDIGGGSTELMWLRLDPGRPPHLIGWLSMPIGVVTLAERHGGIDIGAGAFERMVAEVAAELAPFEAAHDVRRHLAELPVQMLGTSGTVTTVAGVHLDLARYDRTQVDGIWLAAEDVCTVTERLAAMRYDERAAHGCIGVDRADLVVAGCAILAAILRAWPLERLRVADRGVREGVLLDLMRAADTEIAAVGG